MPEEGIVEIPLSSGEKEQENQMNAQESVGRVGVEMPLQPETVREKVEGKYQELLSRVTPTKTAAVNDDDTVEDVLLDAKHIGALTDEESRIEKLLVLAGTKGVVHAVKVARSLKDYYALDRMHDELAGRLYQGLLDKGMITKE